jgi:nucleotide-binding universal stress UspA family protein
MSIRKAAMERRNEVVVGVDGSPASDAAAAWAASEARRRGASLVIVHACEEGAPVRWLPSWMVAAGLRERGRPVVRAARKIAVRTEAGLKIRTGVLKGRATRVLSEMSWHAALLVVGRTGSGSLEQSLPGSIPNRLVAAAHCPVVTIPAWPVTDPVVETGRVVVAVDDGYRRENQIAFAFEEAARHDLDVLVLHAAEQAAADPAWTDRLLAETARARELRPWLRLSVSVLDGPLRDVVAAGCEPSDLLVLGHHRLHVLPGVVGARVRYVLDAAPCPVAVVREASVAHRPAFARLTADPPSRVGVPVGRPPNDHRMTTE